MKILIDKIVNKIVNKDKNFREIQREIENIKLEIGLVCEQINKTDIWFEGESNEDLIDACIYQREFLNARYRYLLKKIKKFHIKYNTISQKG